jgi:hypothetical protein
MPCRRAFQIMLLSQWICHCLSRGDEKFQSPETRNTDELPVREARAQLYRAIPFASLA